MAAVSGSGGRWADPVLPPGSPSAAHHQRGGRGHSAQRSHHLTPMSDDARARAGLRPGSAGNGSGARGYAPEVDDKARGGSAGGRDFGATAPARGGDRRKGNAGGGGGGGGGAGKGGARLGAVKRSKSSGGLPSPRAMPYGGGASDAGGDRQVGSSPATRGGKGGKGGKSEGATRIFDGGSAAGDMRSVAQFSVPTEPSEATLQEQRHAVKFAAELTRERGLLTPRRLPNFMRSCLITDDGKWRDDVDLEEHAAMSGLPVTNATVQEICEANPRILSLSLNDCADVTDVGLWTIAKANTVLQSLTVSGLPQITHVGLRSLSLRCRDLATLDLSRCALVNDMTLRVVAGGMWNLRNLSVRDCKFVSDGGVAELARNCRRLESLNLSKCATISDAAMRDLATFCTSLTKLNVGGCKIVKDKGVGYLMQGCPYLNSLRLSGCFDISARGVQHMATYGANLATLNLAGCKYIRTEDVQTLLECVPSLTDLNVRKCLKVKDRGMMEALSFGRRLESFNVSRCSKVSDVSLRAMASGLSSLRKLDLSDCPRVSEDGIRVTVVGCTRLTTLVLDGCGLVSKLFVTAIAHELPFVQEATEWLGLQPLEDADSRIALTELRRTQAAAATRMQQIYRGRMARLFVAQVRHRLAMERAAPAIQKVVRGHFGRKRAKRRRQQLMREEAALAVQCVFRGMKGRRLARRRARFLRLQANRDYAAREIQRVYRGHVGRKVAERVRLDHYMDQQLMLKDRRKRNKAAQLIQTNYKTVRARRSMQVLRERLHELKNIQIREEAAAVWIQKVFRSNIAKKTMSRLRWERDEAARREAAALMVQRITRGGFAREEARIRRDKRAAAQLLKATRMVQRVWRGSRGRHMYSIMRSLAELRFFEHKAVRMIQNRWRTYRARLFLAVLMAAKEAESSRVQAIAKIQKMYRGMRGREDAVVKRNMSRVEALAAPIRHIIDELEMARQGVQLRFVQIRKRVQEAEGNLLNWSTELEEVKTIKAKFYDSDKVSGTMQRYKTSFLRKALRAHIKDMSARLGPMRERMNMLAAELRDLDRAIRIKRRELKPLEQDVETQTREARRKKLSGMIQQNRWAAKKIQALFRGRRVRKAVAVGYCAWVELWDEESGYVYYFNTATEETTWTKPIDFEIYGGGMSQPTLTGWIKYRDESEGGTGEYYYYNLHSGEYRWEEPADMYDDPSLAAPKAPWEMELTEDAMKDQEWFFGQEIKILSSRSHKRRVIGRWYEMWSDEYQCSYYMHSVTSECRWSLSPRSAKHIVTASAREREEAEAAAADADYKERLADVAEGDEGYYDDNGEWVSTTAGERDGAEPMAIEGGDGGVVGGGGGAGDGASAASRRGSAAPASARSGGQGSSMGGSLAGESTREPWVDTESGRSRPPQAPVGEVPPDATTELEKPGESAYNEQWFERADKGQLTARSQKQRVYGDWQEFYDETSQTYYWYNERHGESSWEMPPEVAEMEAAAPYGSEAWFGGLEPEEVQRLSARSDKLRTWDDWAELRDPTSGAVYYYNAATGESDWDMPETVRKLEEAMQSTRRSDDDEEKIDDVVGWQPPAPTTKDVDDAADTPRTAMRRAKEREARAHGAAGSAAGARPTSAHSSVGGEGLWPDVHSLPHALRSKLKRVEAEEREYPDRAAHVRFLQEHLADREYLMASGVADQMLALQRKAREAEERAAKVAAKKAAEAAERQRLAELDQKRRQEEEEAARKAAEDERKRVEEEAKEKERLAAIREAKLKAKAEAEAKHKAELEEAARVAAEDRAREGREAEAMEAAEDESRRAQFDMQEASERWYAQLAVERQQEELAAAAAEAEADAEIAALVAGEASIAKAAGEGADAWVAVDDPASGGQYWFNTVTKESSWEDPRAQEVRHELAAVSAFNAAASPGYYSSAMDGRAGTADSKTSNWTPVTDPDSGAEYYYNEETGESSWEAPTAAVQHELMAVSAFNAAGAAVQEPPEGGPDAEWVECYDDSTAQTYFFNEKSQESSWTPPAAEDGSLLPVRRLQAVAAFAAAAASSAADGTAATTEYSEAGRPVLAVNGRRYEVNVAPDGTEYYYDMESGVSLWERPTEGDGSEAGAAGAAT